MGIRTPWVDALTFGLGAGIAGVAGVALTQIDNVGPNLGQATSSTPSWSWCSAGSAISGARSSAACRWASSTSSWNRIAGAVLGKIFVLVASSSCSSSAVPRGLFPLKGRAAERVMMTPAPHFLWRHPPDGQRRLRALMKARPARCSAMADRVVWCSSPTWRWWRRADLPPAVPRRRRSTCRATLPHRQIPLLCLLALAVDLVWGYCGILSLGHAAFFALGGYAMGMYLMRQIGPRGVYGNPVLPDFMVFLNWKELPWFWHGFDRFWFALMMVALVPACWRWSSGWLAFRIPGHRGLSLDHHPGPDLRPAAGVLPQRHGLRRQQRLDRLQGHAWASTCRATPPAPLSCFDRGGAGAASWVCRAVVDIALRPVLIARARRREPHAASRLSGRGLQALRVSCCRRCSRASRGRCTCRRSASSIPASSSRHQLDRGGDLGRRRRARHADRRGIGGGSRQLRQDLVDGGAA